MPDNTSYPASSLFRAFFISKSYPGADFSHILMFSLI